jgi:DNA-binding transcriptional MerR regulator
LYHEKGLLQPAEIDRFTSYRYFGEHAVERARAIRYLRDMQFSLAEIKEILDSFADEGDLIPFLRKQKQVLSERITTLRRVAKSVDAIQRLEQSAARMSATATAVKEKELPDLFIACIRWRGSYSETGRYMGLLGRNVGRYVCGRPFNL